MKYFKTLDQTVLDGLSFLKTQKLKKVQISKKVKILVVGSGNAHVAGSIIFRNHKAIYATESNYIDVLKVHNDIELVVVISASGGKHAPQIIRYLMKKNKKIVLLTSTKNSQSESLLNTYKKSKITIYPKLAEMYTYNFSTYLAMILPHTADNISDILDFLENKLVINENLFKNQKNFFFILPNRFSLMSRMLNVKFIELFGRNFCRDIETEDYMLHATTVVPGNELFISFEKENIHYGKKRLHIDIPRNADYAFFMCLTYYLIGKIQSNNKPYFKKNIQSYIKKTNKLHGLTLKDFG